MINFIHPDESFFFPHHLFISLVIFFIFISVLLIYRHYSKLKYQSYDSSNISNKIEKQLDSYINTTPSNSSISNKNAKFSEKLDVGDKLTIIGIILTVIFTGIYPFIQKPILDYSEVDGDKNDAKFGIEVINRGFATANDVTISVQSNVGGFKLLTLEPSMNYTINKTDETSSYVHIDFLPPSSETILNYELSNLPSVNNTTIMTHVRSQESTGHYDTLIKMIFYLSLSIIFGFVFIYLSYWHKLGLKRPANWKILHKREKKSLIYIFLIIVSYIVIFSMSYHILNSNYQNINITDNNWRLGYPVILITFIIIFVISIILFFKQERWFKINKKTQ